MVQISQPKSFSVHFSKYHNSDKNQCVKYIMQKLQCNLIYCLLFMVKMMFSFVRLFLWARTRARCPALGGCLLLQGISQWVDLEAIQPGAENKPLGW